MIKAIQYKELSSASNLILLPENTAICNCIEHLEDKIILVNGKEVSSDYILQKDDIVLIRNIPSGTTAAIVASIIIGAVALTTGVVVGVQSYKQKKELAKLQEEAKRAAERQNDSVINLPYLRGANNSTAKNKTQPYIIGEHLFTQYYLQTSFSKISGYEGKDQFLYQYFVCGFNKQVLRNIYADDIKLKTFTEDTPQQGRYQFDQGIFYDPENFIEVIQDGSSSSDDFFNCRIEHQESGTQLKKRNEIDYEPIYFTLNRYSKNADVCIMINGLRAYNSSGTEIQTAVKVVPQVSYDNGTTWTDFYFYGVTNNTIWGNTLSQLRFNAHIDFTYAQVSALDNPIIVRVISDSDKSDFQAYQDVYIQWVQSEIYDPIKSKDTNDFVNDKIIDDPEKELSTIICMKTKATFSNQEKMTKVNTTTSGTARIWDGINWSVDKVPTRNPASWLLEVLTSHTHPISAIDDSEVDLDSFGEAYDYCVANDLNVDMVLISGDTKETVLTKILTVFNAALYNNAFGLLAIAIDDVKQNAIGILNEQNLISFTWNKENSRQADGVKVNFINRNADYAQDMYLVMRDNVERTSESILREITLEGVTTYEQVVKAARRMLAGETLRPYSYTAQVGKEGIYYELFAKMLLQHPSLKIGIGSAEIKTAIINSDNQVTSVVLYEPIEYDSINPNGFGCIIQSVTAERNYIISRKITADNTHTILTFEDPVDDIVSTGDILSYGYLNEGSFDTITTPLIITGFEPSDDGYTLYLTNYDERIFETGTIGEYISNISHKQQGTSLPQVPPILSGVDGKDGRDGVTRTLIFLTRDNVVLHKKPSGEWSTQYPITVDASVYSGIDIIKGSGYVAYPTNGFAFPWVFKWSSPIFWSLENAPEGITIDKNTGKITIVAGNYIDYQDIFVVATLNGVEYKKIFNISVVYDGVGIDTIENKYQVTSSQNKPIEPWDNNVWTYEIPSMDSENKYLWRIERTLYTDGTAKDNVYLQAVQGNTGESEGKYLGKSDSIPNGNIVKIKHSETVINDIEAKNLDYFAYVGETSGNFEQGLLYQWYNDAWNLIDPNDSSNTSYYMSSLNDITQDAPAGVFNTLFARNIMAMQATIDELSTKVIKLQQGGVIYGGSYLPDGTNPTDGKGFYLDAEGNMNLEKIRIKAGINPIDNYQSNLVNKTQSSLYDEISQKYSYLYREIPYLASGYITYDTNLNQRVYCIIHNIIITNINITILTSEFSYNIPNLTVANFTTRNQVLNSGSQNIFTTTSGGILIYI